MRATGWAGVALLVAGALACTLMLVGTRAPVPPAPVAPAIEPAPPPPRVQEPYHDAEKGPVKFGDALVSVHRVWETKYETVPTLSIALRIECLKEANALTIKGWATDYTLIESLTGKVVVKHAGPEPLPVNFSVQSNGKILSRGLQRLIVSDPEAKVGKVPVGTRELKVQPGEVYHLIHEVERPHRIATELFLDTAAEDVGHKGRLRFQIAAAAIVRE